jgi:hypothetical protein
MGCCDRGEGQYRHVKFAELQERLSLAEGALARERGNRFYGQRGVEAALQLSWQELDGVAQRLGMLLGLFAAVDLPWALVQGVAEEASFAAEALSEARGRLDRLHLIQPVDETCEVYRIHPLVREFLRRKLSGCGELEKPLRLAFVT